METKLNAAKVICEYITYLYYERKDRRKRFAKKAKKIIRESFALKTLTDKLYPYIKRHIVLLKYRKVIKRYIALDIIKRNFIKHKKRTRTRLVHTPIILVKAKSSYRPIERAHISLKTEDETVSSFTKV